MTLGKHLAAAIAAVIPAVIVTAPTVAAGSDKVAVCHWSEGRGHILITVSSRAAAAHASVHDEDFLPAGDDCDPTPVLARATGTDADGNEFEIARLEDTNRDGSVSAQDMVRVHRHPVEFDGSGGVPAVEDFGVTEHTVTVVHRADPTQVMVQSADGTFWFQDMTAIEGFVEMTSAGHATLFVDMVGGLGGFGETDMIQLSASSPSAPGGIPNGSSTHSVKAVESDDAWLEVEISS